MKTSDKIQYDRYLKGEGLPHFRTLSGIKMKEFYTREDSPRDPQDPGIFPFTRGIYKDMYRSRLWIRRQQSGFGTPVESNHLIHYLLSKGMTGLKSQWIENQINEARYEYARQLETGEQIQVGVNMEREEDEEVKINMFRQASHMQEKRIRYIRTYKPSRNEDQVKKVLDKLYRHVKNNPDGDFFSAIHEAVDQKATLGKMSDTLRQAYDFTVHYV
jgi:methylmalonyl-CoA mutase N-terminal domain/subunit